MLATLLCAATLSVGVDAGWKKLSEGGMEYLIQVRPEELDLLKSGEAFFSDIDPTVQKHLRSFRLSVGREALQRDPPPAPQPAPAPAAASPAISPTPPPRAAFPQTNPAAGAPLPAFPPSAPLPSPKVVPPAATTPQPEPPPRYSTPPYPKRDATPNGPTVDLGSRYPRTVTHDPQVRPLTEQPAAYNQPQTEVTARPVLPADAPTAEPAPQRPWWALVASLVALSASVTWNAYLSWVLVEARRRYRTLLNRVTRPAAKALLPVGKSR